MVEINLQRVNSSIKIESRTAPVLAVHTFSTPLSETTTPKLQYDPWAFLILSSSRGETGARGTV